MVKGCGCAFCEQTSRLNPLERACALLLDLSKAAKREEEGKSLKDQAKRLLANTQRKSVT